MIRAKDCFAKGLLIKSQPDINLALKSLKQAESFLDEASDLIDLQKDRPALFALYNAYFHAARALLFRDGIKERSHFCIARYLEDKYVNKNILNIDFLVDLETARDLRHELQYSLMPVEFDIEFNDMYNKCEEFINQIKELLNK